MKNAANSVSGSASAAAREEDVYGRSALAAKRIGIRREVGAAMPMLLKHGERLPLAVGRWPPLAVGRSPLAVSRLPLVNG
jgi:hypothetical protein